MKQIGFILIVVAVVAILITVSVVRAKKAKRQKFIEGLQVKFMNLQASSKAVNEPYIRESSEFLMYDAPRIKDKEQIKVGLLNILAKYKEAGKLSKDDFYNRAFETITK